MLQHAPQVIVIGGGPAGASCALWLHQLGVKLLLLEADASLGGLQRQSPYTNRWVLGVIDTTGQQIANNITQQLNAENVPFYTNSVVKSVAHKGSAFEVKWGRHKSNASYVVLATGTRPISGGFKPSATLAIGPGEPMERLEVKGKRVAILGGGDNAFDQARFALNRGAAQVTIFTRRQPCAQKLMQQQANGARVIIGPFEANQKRMDVNGERFDVIGVMYGFEAVLPQGLSPQMLKNYVAVKRSGQTSITGLYACGDLTNYWHPSVITAAAHGAQVAKQIASKLLRPGE